MKTAIANIFDAQKEASCFLSNNKFQGLQFVSWLMLEKFILGFILDVKGPTQIRTDEIEYRRYARVLQFLVRRLNYVPPFKRAMTWIYAKKEVKHHKFRGSYWE